MDSVVVSYNNDVNKEILAGYAKLVDKSIPALVKGLKTALDPNYQAALSGIAHEWVETEFDAERMSLEYQDLYRKVLMSAVTDILTSVINLKRNTSFLVDEVAIAASVAIDRQPSKSCRLEVEIVGNTIATGLINVVGNVNETFNFSANGVEVGEQNFTSISGITTSGIEDGFIKIRALSKMGQPLNQEILVSENMPIRFFAEKGHIRMMEQGQEDVSNYRLIAEPSADVQDNDRIYAVSGIFGLTLGEIKFSEKLYDFNGSGHHIEAEISKL